MRNTLLLLMFAACDGSNTTSVDMSVPPLACGTLGIGTACGKPCANDSVCGDALYCGPGGMCEAQCLAGDERCGMNAFCGPHGHCITIGEDAFECPSVDVNLAPLIPTVILLIDQSGSMNDKDFMQGGTAISRWDAMKGALNANPGGVLPTLESKVKFGADLYTGLSATMECPKLTELGASLNNAGAIKTLMDNNPPADDTPTGESLNALVANLKMLGPGPDPSKEGPTVIALATDGDPDTCAAPDSNGTDPPKQVSIMATQAAFTAGYPVYILGVSDDINAGHLQDLANAGAGLAVGGAQKAPFFTAHTPMDLVNAFTTIIRGARTCTFKLNGSVDLNAAGTGTVKLNGMDLGYMDANGWTLSDASTMELQGTACTTFKDQDVVTLTANFPCGVVIM